MRDNASATTNSGDALNESGEPSAAESVVAALDLFDADCFGRSLMAFAWNIKILRSSPEAGRGRPPDPSRRTGVGSHLT